jgi:uncharacterized protein with PQ loop repeat
MAPQECPPIVEGIDFYLGAFLLVGTLISFLPQHVKLLKKESHVGLSLYKGAVGTITATCGATYFVALQTYSLFYCCPTPFVCFGHVLPFLQLAMIVLCDVAILFLYVYYFDLKFLADSGIDYHRAWAETRYAVLGTFAVQLVLACTLLGLALTKGFGSDAMNLFGGILVVCSSVGQFVQWTPQIVKTYQLKRVGALSLPMIFLQAGGAALTAYFFSVDGEWYIWTPFVISSVLLTVLFVESMYYVRQAKLREANGGGAGNVQGDDYDNTDPLLTKAR